MHKPRGGITLHQQTTTTYTYAQSNRNENAHTDHKSNNYNNDVQQDVKGKDTATKHYNTSITSNYKTQTQTLLHGDLTRPTSGTSDEVSHL